VSWHSERLGEAELTAGGSVTPRALPSRPRSGRLVGEYRLGSPGDKRLLHILTQSGAAPNDAVLDSPVISV